MKNIIKLALSLFLFSADAQASNPPCGANGATQYNKNGSCGAYTPNGDATINPATGLVTITKTNGVAFTAAATRDTTQVFPTINSMSAASANVTLIQNALNAGGKVDINCLPYGASETDTIGASPYQKSVVNAGVFYLGDAGVSYASSGTPLTKVLSSPTTGQYTVSNTGTYTFSSGDSGQSVSIGYNWAAPVWLNGHLTVHSTTDFIVEKACHLEQMAAINDNMLVNAAYLTPWTTEYINSGLIANGPLAEIWSGNTPAWAVSTAYVKGNYAVANGNIYWENATTCTSASSGNGPTGNSGTSTGPTGTTGAAIADGTCSWYYVTTQQFANSANLTATVYYPNSGLSFGSFITLSPQPDNVASSNLWTGTQTAHTAGGPCDSAYFGTFQVVAINDSKYVTVMLKRPPASAFSGIPMYMKPADFDIMVEGGGTWDYNYANNPGGTAQSENIVLLSSAARVQVKDMTGANTSKYELEFNGVTNFEANNTKCPAGCRSDTVHVYGSFDGIVRNTFGFGQDDVIALQTCDNTPNVGEIISSQDLLNVSAINTYSESGGNGVTIDPSNGALFMDNIIVDGVSSHSYTGSSPLLPVVMGTNPGQAPLIGTLTIKNIDIRDGQYLFFSLLTGSIENLILENINAPYNPANLTTSLVYFQDGTYQNILLKDSRFFYSGSSNYVVGTNTPTINHLKIDGGYFGAAAGYYGNLVQNGSGATVNQLDIEHVTVPTSMHAIVQNSSANNIQVNIKNNYFKNVAIGYESGGGISNVSYSGNTLYGIYSGLFFFGATSTIIGHSAGDNTIGGGTTWWNYAVGTDTASSYGWDISCDVTKMTRTTGEYCLNTNTAPGSGTLTTAGPVMDQGTSSGSWFALFNPVGQTY